MSQPELENWERFLRYTSRARGKPSFDFEEREYRLEVAQRLHGMLSSIKQGRTTIGIALETVFVGSFSGQPYALTAPRHNDWLKKWASSDADSLDGALMVFLEDHDPPNHRFDQFVERARGAPVSEVSDLPVAQLFLMFGSLFNFAVAPLSLPVVHPGLFHRLMGILCDQQAPASSVTEMYERSVEFSREIEKRLVERGVPIRDMADVQSLVWIAGEDQALWTRHELPPPVDRRPVSGGSTSNRASDRERPYLSVCAIYRDEAEYLQEWIEFHRLIGVERFFLYDNLSSDDHQGVLAPYVDEGIVVIHDWPISPAGQRPAYQHCLDRYRDESRWIAFIDVDEFLFSPTGRPISAVLGDYEAWPAVGVGMVNYGSSGHRTKPSGLVVESYLKRDSLQSIKHVKSVVDPKRTTRCASVHHFEYQDLPAADENGYPIRGDSTKWVSVSRLRLNHYVMKSEEEFRMKCAIPQAADARLRIWFDMDALRNAFNNADPVILRYVPELRAAMTRSSPGVEADLASSEQLTSPTK